jgi:hypothetical protein
VAASNVQLDEQSAGGVKMVVSGIVDVILDRGIQRAVLAALLPWRSWGMDEGGSQDLNHVHHTGHMARLSIPLLVADIVMDMQ